MSSKEFGVGTTIPEVQRKSCIPRWPCERQLWSLCSVCWTGLISSTNDGSKGNGCCCSTAWLWRTSSWRNIGIHPGKKCEDPVVPLERNLYGHPLAGPLWERQVEKALLELGWVKVPNWECLFVHRKQKLFLSVCVDDIKMAGKKQNFSSYVEEMDERRWYWGANIVSWSRFSLCCIQRGCKPNEKIIGQDSNYVRIPYFLLESVVPRRGRTCSKMRGTVLRIGKQKRPSATVQSSSSVFGRSPNQKGRIGHACTWHEMVDLTFCGQSINWQNLSQNGLKHVTDDWHDKFPTFISRLSTANIVMWAMRLNTVDWFFLKIQTLQGILKTKNPQQAEFCAFLEVEHLFRSVGCERSARHYLAALQNQRSYRWMLVCVWTVYLRSTCGERLQEYQQEPERAHGKPVLRPKHSQD